LVYFNPQAVAHKKLPELNAEQVGAAFGSPAPEVYTNSMDVRAALDQAVGTDGVPTVVALMSSGNFDGNDVSDWTRVWA
jgi:UDP-N-acetylmuramate: L-alanyl-gamma-D-glutamyl-meso-diaminopimelate ligase